MLPLPFKTVKRFFWVVERGGGICGLCQILPKNIKIIRIKVLEEIYQYEHINILSSGISKDSFIFK